MLTVGNENSYADISISILSISSYLGTDDMN